MKPKPPVQQPQRELFRVELSLLVDTDHPLVKLAGRINWALFEEQLGATYHAQTGAPGIDTTAGDSRLRLKSGSIADG